MLTPNQKSIEQILVTITQNPNGYLERFVMMDEI
jgi:hypothetical protein